MRIFPTALLLSLFLIGCSSQPRRSLAEGAAPRVYAANLQQVFDAVRLHCLKEGFTVDRFEQESGSIIAHKVYQQGGPRADNFGPANHLIVMHIRVHEVAPGRTEAATSITFGNGQVVASRDDESILLDNYSSLYATMDAQLGPPRLEVH